MIARTLGVAAITYATVFALVISAAAGFGSGLDGCNAICGEARDFLNAPEFALGLGLAFVALLASIPLMILGNRRT